MGVLGPLAVSRAPTSEASFSRFLQVFHSSGAGRVGRASEPWKTLAKTPTNSRLKPGLKLFTSGSVTFEHAEARNASGHGLPLRVALVGPSDACG